MGEFNTSLVVLTLLSLVFILAFISLFLWVGWFFTNRQGSVSPYTGQAMKKGEDLAFFATQQVDRYLKEENLPLFDFKQAAICTQTGRIFPDVVNRFGIITLKWNFIKKCYPGRYVSFGSLPKKYQKELLKLHSDHQFFNTEFSAPVASPKSCPLEYALSKPGPLYVDPSTQVLVGWKNVPGTNLEVLVASFPREL